MGLLFQCDFSRVCLKGNRLIVHRRHDRNMYIKSFLTLTLFKLMLMSGVWKTISFIID